MAPFFYSTPILRPPSRAKGCRTLSRYETSQYEASVAIFGRGKILFAN